MWMASSPTLPLRYRPVRETPIYVQLRGECLNAEVPPREADPHQVDHHGKHHRLAERPPGSFERKKGIANLLGLSGGTGVVGSVGSISDAGVRRPWLCP